MASLSPTPKLQFFGTDGLPLVGGKLYTYAAGTTTPLASYTDHTGITANTNPVILDSAGEADVWLPETTAYKYVLKDADDVTLFTVDYVSVPLTANSFASPPPIGSDVPNSGTFTTLNVTGAAIFEDTANFTEAVEFDADVTISGRLSLTDTGAAKLNVGTTAQRPVAPVNGDIRYNSDTSKYEGYSGSAAKRAVTFRKVADSAVAGIPLGQPILVGHHSERRHRNALERSHRNMGKSFKEADKSNYWARRAESALRRADGRYTAPATKRRIEELEADRRRWLRELDQVVAGEKRDGAEKWAGMRQHWERWVWYTDHRLAFERALLASSMAAYRIQRPSIQIVGTAITIGTFAAYFPAAGKILTSAGTSYTLGGLSTNTWYYVYATQAAGVITTYATSTTAPDATLQHKTGDVDSIYVCCFRTDGGAAPYAVRSVGGRYLYEDNLSVLSGGSSPNFAGGAVSLASFVPPHARSARIRASLFESTAVPNYLYVRPKYSAGSSASVGSIIVQTSVLLDTQQLESEIGIEQGQGVEYMVAANNVSTNASLFVTGFGEAM